MMNLDEQVSRVMDLAKPGMLIAIDGMSASGKSTLGARLQRALDANLFHMDDFFLTPALRTPARLQEAGGNVDYERFFSEVLVPLSQNRPFSYRPYDCGTGRMGDRVLVAPRPIAIVEGAYSLHPHFGAPYGLKVFMEISPEIQKARIAARNGDIMLNRFLSEWIPLETRYFARFGIREKCDLVLP